LPEGAVEAEQTKTYITLARTPRLKAMVNGLINKCTTPKLEPELLC